MNLKFAETLSLPPDAVTQKFAFLARSGAGKTYAAGRLVESMLDHGDQVIVLDPVGVWWGLRLAANGQDKGFDVPVFGGEQGDVPLYPENGALVARTLVTNGVSAVLDLSPFRKNERVRFMTEFGEEFFQLKKKHRSPVHLVLEEAQTFCPQFIKGVERMVGTMEDIIKLGRNYGIGVSLISQRPQAVNKDVLNQTEVLVVLQTTGPQERKTIKGWIVEAGLDIQELVDELPALGRHQKGEAFVWSPSWLGITKRVQIEKKTTYDVSRTPTAAVRKRAAKALSESDLEALRENMKVAVEKAKAEDPAELKKKLAEQERAFKALKTEFERITNKLKEPAPEKVKVTPMGPMLSKREKRQLAAIASMVTPFSKIVPILEKIANPMFKWEVEPLKKGATALAIEKQGGLSKSALDSIRNDAKASGLYTSPKAPAKPSPATFAEGEYQPTGGAKRMLEWLKRAGPTMSRRKVALLARIKTTGGSFGTYLSALKTAGFIEIHGDDVILTEAGAAVVPHCSPVPAEQLINMWANQFTGGARRMFDYLVENDDWVTRACLSQAARVDQSGGSFGTYLSQLRTSGVIETNGDTLRLHPDLRSAS